MKQYEAVIEALKQNGGYATLGQLYQDALKIPDCEWKTKTPFASIRRIVQVRDEIFKIRPGLWALESEREKVMEIFSEEKSRSKAREYTHYFYQGLVTEIGNLKGYKTFVPAQDKNRPYAQKTLKDVATLTEFYPFTYPEVLRQAVTIDVTWFNERRFATSFFEIEHSTDIHRSLLKFVELQDFRADFFIVADAHREAEFEDKISLAAFSSIKPFVKFINYDNIANLHTKITEVTLAEKAIF